MTSSSPAAPHRDAGPAGGPTLRPLRIPREAWAGLLADDGLSGVPAAGFCATLPWFDTLARTTLAPDERAVALALARPGSEVPQALLFLRSPAGQRGSMLHRWRWRCGEETVASLTGHQSCAYGAVVRGDVDDEVVLYRELGRAFDAPGRRPVIVDLNLFPEGSPARGALADGLAGVGYITQTYDYKGSWFENVAGRSFDEYLSDRPASARKALQNYARKSRRLARTSAMTFSMVSAGDAVEPAIEAFLAVEAGSWKEPEPHPAFVPEVMRAAAARGQLRLGMVHLGGRCVAVELALLAGGHATMLKTHYLEEERRNSVGAVAILETMRHLMDEDRVDAIDFGTDDDEYKALWCSQRQVLGGIVAVDPRRLEGVRARARLLAHRGAEALRRSAAAAAVKRLLRRGA